MATLKKPSQKNAQIEKIGRVTSASVHKCTGRHWHQWIRLLERAGAAQWTHREIVAHLKKVYKLSPWWQQGVATGYETHLGKKIPGYSETNGFSTAASRTFPMGTAELWKFIFSAKALKCWLKPLSEFSLQPKAAYEAENGVFGQVRTLKPRERLRMTWQEEDWAKASVLQIAFIPRTAHKSVLVFQQDKLPNGRARAQMRDYWKQVLTELLAT